MLVRLAAAAGHAANASNCRAAPTPVEQAALLPAEFATVGVRRSRIQQLAQEGNPLARSLLPVVEDAAKLDRYIAASQIGPAVREPEASRSFLPLKV